MDETISSFLEELSSWLDTTDVSNDELIVQGHKASQVRKSHSPSPSRRSQSPSPARKSRSPSPARRSRTPSPSTRRVSQQPRSLKTRPYQSPIAADEKHRDELRSTYVQLMQELEAERERRWKSEKATKKLVDHINELQTRAKDGEEIQTVAVQATTRLKQALTNEKEAGQRLNNQLDALEAEIKKKDVEIESHKKTIASHHSALRAAETTVTKMERERIQQEAHQNKKVHEAQARAAASAREVDILRAQVTTLKGQLHQLQELLADREQKHREELSSRYSLNSPQLQDVLKREVSRTEKSHAEELRIQQSRIDTLSRQYSELEDEFRAALQIEANRFSEVQDAFQQSAKEAAHNKQALAVAMKKEENMNAMIVELTALVKEQKGRISELAKAKQEQHMENKERIQSLEVHVEEARKRMVTMEMLKQEKTKLLSQLQAQESIIAGLKAERKLWGEELAQQGASLASDRGRMEAKIETLMNELSTCKKHLEREADSVKIKTKLIDDQTETIRKLKEALLERDQEVRRARDDAVKGNRDLEEQLQAEQAANQELQERLDRARERKDELKQQVEELQDQLEETQKAHSSINNKWKEKSSVIGQLEDQVQQMKASWQAREKKLTEERDKSLDAARIAVGKIQSLDDAFRRQLDTKEENHQRVMERLTVEKQEEIDVANKRVIEVEEEMRELLRESAVTKRTMEEKFKKLSSAFSEMQHDLL